MGVAQLTHYISAVWIIIAVLFLSSAKGRFGRFWERIARGKIPVDFDDKYAMKGSAYRWYGSAFIFISLLCFALGSVVALIGFAKA